MKSSHERTVPRTYFVDVRRSMEILGHREMLALSTMYRHWALTEEDISPEQRTKIMLWSADYERIAEYAGESWKPSDPDPENVIAFLGKLALQSGQCS